MSATDTTLSILPMLLVPIIYLYVKQFHKPFQRRYSGQLAPHSFAPTGGPLLLLYYKSTYHGTYIHSITVPWNDDSYTVLRSTTTTRCATAAAFPEFIPCLLYTSDAADE